MVLSPLEVDIFCYFLGRKLFPRDGKYHSSAGIQAAGLEEQPHCRILLFTVFLVIYLLTILGNIIVTSVVTLEPQLHLPMYKFLQNLSFLEVCYTTTIVPKMLANLLAKRKSISFAGCMVQLYHFISLGACGAPRVTKNHHGRCRACRISARDCEIRPRSLRSLSSSCSSCLISLNNPRTQKRHW